MTIESTAALVTLRAIVSGGADVLTPETHRAAVLAVSAIRHPRVRDHLLGLIEASFAAILLCEVSDEVEDLARADLSMILDMVEAAARQL
jgi:hypothetical protein